MVPSAQKPRDNESPVEEPVFKKPRKSTPSEVFILILYAQYLDPAIFCVII